MSVLDAEFLNVEDDVAHMHIAGLCVFEDPPPTIGELHDLVASKLHRIPRYRQRARSVPLELGRPVWVDDPNFNLGYHIRHTALPAPGRDEELSVLMGRLMSQPLDRDRPLWEAWLIEGIEGGRWAIVFKVHHCMVDGIAGVGLLTVLLDADPVLELSPPEPWEPAPEPHGLAMVVDAWTGLAGDVAGWVRRIPGVVGDPKAALRVAGDTGRGIIRFVTSLVPTAPLSIEGTIGAHRVWAHSSASLGDIATIRAAFGGTINDVILAAVSGGYRELLASRGEDADHAVVRSMIPVSVRTEDAAGVTDNRVSTLLYDLPVHVADPVERLHQVHDEMVELKGSHMAQAAEVVTSVGNLAPPMIVGSVTRLAMRSEHLVPQRMVNTVTTNVPGPQFPLYCIGREMLEYRPYVPISHGVRVGTAILSYNGQVCFGVTGDFDTAPDVGVVADAAAAEIDVLRDRALARKKQPRRRK